MKKTIVMLVASVAAIIIIAGLSNVLLFNSIGIWNNTPARNFAVA